jgi:hypothetical protein
MTTLSAKGDVDGSTPSHTQGMFKTGVGKMWQAFVDLFGSDSGAMRTVHETAKLNGPGILQNLKLTPSVGSNALTMTVQTRAGAVPSASDPVLVSVRNATATTGDSLLRQVSATLALVISSGSTLGHTSGAAGTIYWYLVDSDGAGAMKLAASTAYYGPSFIGTTVAEGGAGAADSASAIYSDAVYASKAMRLVGKTTDTQTTAGTWAALPSQIDLWPFDAPASGASGAGFMPLTASIGANALTVSLPAGTVLNFNDGTSVTLASTITATASSGSTLGTVSSTPSCIWVAAIKNSGTPELAIRNNVSNVAGDAISIVGSSLGEVISTTAEGGAGAADAAQTWYSTTSRSNQPWAPVGFVLSTQTTAGTWAQAIDRTVGFGPGVALPGQTIGLARKETGALVSGSTSIPFDDSIPQNTEGVLVLTATYSRRLAAGLLEITAVIQSAESGNTSDQMAAALFQDSISNALKASALPIPATNNSSAYPLSHVMVCGATGNTDIKLRAGLNTASQIDFNGVGSARKYGGVLDTSITIREYQP